MKKILLGCLITSVVGILIMLVGCGAIIANWPKDGEKLDTSSAGETAAVKKVKMNEQFVLDDIAYKVVLTKTMKKIGDSYTGTKAESGATFLLVSYAMVNISKASKTVVADPFKIQTADGTTYEPDSTAQTAMIMAGDKQEMILSQLGPGIQKVRIAAFQIPDKLKVKDLTLVVSSDNMFSGTEPIQVELK